MKLYAYLLLLIVLIFGVVYCYKHTSISTTGTLTVHNGGPIDIMPNESPLLTGTTADMGNGVNRFVLRDTSGKHVIFMLHRNGGMSLYGDDGKVVGGMNGNLTFLWASRAVVQDRISKVRTQLEGVSDSYKNNSAYYREAFRSLTLLERTIQEIEGDVIR